MAVPPAGTVVKQSVDAGNSVRLVAVTFEIVTGVPPTFVTVTVVGAPCVPTCCDANVMGAGI